MWNTISKPWQAAFEQGWEAYKNGSIPIGAVITDESDNIISLGRNHIFEASELNPKIAHAEIEAMRKLDVIKHPNVYQYTLYACMEPCPMCLGTFVMSNLRTLRVAARDSYCGAVHYCNEDPYIISKNINITFEYGILEIIQLVMQTYFELKQRNGKMNKVTELFEKDNPIATKIAKALYSENFLEQCVNSNKSFEYVFNVIHSYL